MVILNRKRTLLNQETPKDPSQYWYIEKYVYGELKEIVEIPLGTSTKFTAVESGYLDDRFYGWSTDGTSTARTFTDTASYSNTTSSVKNLLDSENTIKIYAVYKYTTTVGTYFSLSGAYEHNFTMKEDGVLSLNGYSTIRTVILSNGNTVSDTTTEGSVTFHIYDSNGAEKQTISTHRNTVTANVTAGDRISITTVSSGSLPTGTGSSSPPSGTWTLTTSQATISSTGEMYAFSSAAKYRVESHTA